MTTPTEIVRAIAGVTVLAALAVTLVLGVMWALSPEESVGFEVTEGRRPPRVFGTPTPTPTPPPPPEPEPTPTPTPTPTEDVEAIMAAAREPSDTTVQVLDAGGGSAATNEAAARLGQLGYRVINITSSRTNVAETTVWFTRDNEPEGHGLRVRLDHIEAIVEPNQRLNEGTDLHLLVGPDWQ